MDLLAGTVQHYAWGDRAALSALQKRSPTGEPDAELWFGAHPVAPSRLVGANRSLLDLVVAQPDDVLGRDVVERFGRFPYLLKVLAAAQPLSIQAHPSLAVARAGYDREQAAGIPVDAPTRTYRDDNHKPELICALTAFEAKCGFRDPVVTADTLDQLIASRAASSQPQSDRGLDLLVELSDLLRTGPRPDIAIAEAMRWLLHLSADGARSIVGAVVEGAAVVVADMAARGVDAAAEIRWIDELHQRHPFDIGIVVSLLLHHVVLAPGEAIFLGAGNLHSYLRGVGVELMANSDNVVRGGLTVKHIDVDELLAILDPRPIELPVQRPVSNDHRYESPVAEFSLTRLVAPSRPEVWRFDPAGPEIILVTEGEAELRTAGAATGVTDPPTESCTVRVVQGSAALVGASDGAYEVRLGPATTAWRATVGLYEADTNAHGLPPFAG
jgi:mannose-6-phosphate isomerase